MNARPSPADAPDWDLRGAVAADVEPIAELRALVLRPDLERLGRYDEHRVRQRLRDSFSTEHTSVITVAGSFAGCITVRPAGQDGGRLLEHFYLAPAHQGRGLGSAVLRTVLARADAAGESVRLDVLQGSAARRLYERHGFVLEREDPIDAHLIRPAVGTEARSTVRPAVRVVGAAARSEGNPAGNPVAVPAAPVLD